LQISDVLIFQFGLVRDYAGRTVGSDCKSEMTGSCHAAHGQFRALELKAVEARPDQMIPGGFHGSKPLKSLEKRLSPTH
jgi:hypothetical protein